MILLLKDFKNKLTDNLVFNIGKDILYYIDNKTIIYYFQYIKFRQEIFKRTIIIVNLLSINIIIVI